MASRIEEVIMKDFHPQAEELVNKHIDHFETSLLLQAQLLAYQQKADIVLSHHIDEAHDLISRREKETWTRKLQIVVGGGFFGASVQGFITALSAGDELLTAIYAVLGFIGMLLVFFGLRR